MKKNNIVRLVFVTVLVLTRTNVLAQTLNSLNWTNLKFIGDSIAGKYYPLLSIHIPFKLESYAFPFEAQFDLGARTQLYENSISSFLKEMPSVSKKLDFKIYRSEWRKTSNFY